MNVKQRLVSFFANPELAYMIMSLGALCIWVELTHPGLIFPGVLGGICIILSLVAFQLLPISYGALALILLGFGLLVAELYLPTFGIVGIAGLFCFVIGSLFLMDSATPEFQISLGLILPTTAVLSAFIFLLGYLILKSRGGRVLSGLGSLVGAQGEVRNSITDHPGKVFLNGELWNAISTTGEDIPEGTKIVVQEVKDMLLVVHRS